MDIETIIGGGGPDIIDASAVIDHPEVIYGGGGNDTIIGTPRADTIHGGPGNDSIHGGDGNDYINADCGRDKVFGDAGDDTLNGGGADPKFIPIPTFQPTIDRDTTGGGSDSSVDTMYGGPGVDVFIVDPFDIFHQGSPA
jgi:Ca2+-binding RTX toxin-like protein